METELNSRILVVEDNPTTSRMLGLFFEDAGFHVSCAYNGREALDKFASLECDLIVLDLMLPDLDGMTVCRTIRQSSDVPIIMLTAKTLEDDVVEGLESGANDYVCKPFGSKELLARVRRCLNHKFHAKRAGENTLQCGELEINLQRREVRVKNNLVKLTKTEYAILKVLLENTGRVFTRHQLIDVVFGPNYDGFDRAIDTHIWNLRKKIGEPKGSPQYIQSEPGIGYRMSDFHEG